MTFEKLLGATALAAALFAAPTVASAMQDAGASGDAPATIDSNGDGKPDAWDTNGDGRADAWDTDGDGKPDATDADGDGQPDKPKSE
jgi:hypothetical protein